jgi:hypothetical protein
MTRATLPKRVSSSDQNQDKYKNELFLEHLVEFRLSCSAIPTYDPASPNVRLHMDWR